MEVLAGKYDVVATNPPYMGSSGMDFRLLEYIKLIFQIARQIYLRCLSKDVINMLKEKVIFR